MAIETTLSLMKQEIAFAWTLKEGDPRRPRLHQKLFGQKVSKPLKDGTIKDYFYDGILYKWADGKRVVDCHHTILNESLFSIPDMEDSYIPAIMDTFKNLKITVRRLRLVENKLFVFR